MMRSSWVPFPSPPGKEVDICTVEFHLPEIRLHISNEDTGLDLVAEAGRWVEDIKRAVGRRAVEMLRRAERGQSS